MSRHRRISAALVLCAAALALSACATPTAASQDPASDLIPGAGFVATDPAPPEGEVIAQGTVMDTGDSVELCLGAIAESYPPQCSGIPLVDWSWDGVDGSETAGDVQWGAYAVQGTYDGTSFTVTQPPIMLALYDPVPLPEIAAGTTDEETLLGIQEEMAAVLGERMLSSGVHDGRLDVGVVWDDDTWQAAADEVYGPGAVAIRSALREITG